jgi:hemoglobin
LKRDVGDRLRAQGPEHRRREEDPGARDEGGELIKSLYQWAGGEAAIRRLMDCFYDRVEEDDLLSPYFPGGVREEHRAHVATWWSEVLGGPAGYTDELGGYENMLARHRGLDHARGAASLRVADQLAADDADLPDDPEFRSALIAYAEWGTRLAMHNSQPGAEVAEHAPVPRWGWGELRAVVGRDASNGAKGSREPEHCPREGHCAFESTQAQVAAGDRSRCRGCRCARRRGLWALHRGGPRCR